MRYILGRFKCTSWLLSGSHNKPLNSYFYYKEYALVPFSILTISPSKVLLRTLQLAWIRCTLSFSLLPSAYYSFCGSRFISFRSADLSMWVQLAFDGHRVQPVILFLAVVQHIQTQRICSTSNETCISTYGLVHRNSYPTSYLCMSKS